MLRANPLGGRPMSRLGAIEVDEGSIKWKIGYCQCGKKILVDRGEMTELVDQFGYLVEHPAIRVKIADFFISKLIKLKGENKVIHNQNIDNI